MGLTYGFYNSVNNDRMYDAVQLSSMFTGILTDGVVKDVGDKMRVSVVSGLNIAVGTGKAWLLNTWTYNDTAYPLTIETADSLLPRIDTVVLEVDSRVAYRRNSLKIIKGTPNSNPTMPILLQTEDVFQMPLAWIAVDALATTIVTEDITDLVGTINCPYVTLVGSIGEVGNREYSENNFITDGEAVTTSLDKLDQSLFDKAGTAKISVGTVAPTTPAVGDIWIDTN